MTRLVDRRRFRFTVPAVAALALLNASVALAKPCKDYAGTFTAVRPAECTSAVGICTHGTLAGGFPSTYDFAIDTLTPTADPTKVAYTGHSVITDAHGGQIFGRDSGVLTFLPNGTASFVTTIESVGGTRKYKHARARFVAPGVLSLATGGTTGTYTGSVCTGSDRGA